MARGDIAKFARGLLTILSGVGKFVNMTQAQVLTLIRKHVAEAGSLRKLALAWGVSPSYVCQVLGGKQSPGPKVLRPMGLRMVRSVTYIKVS